MVAFFVILAFQSVIFRSSFFISFCQTLQQNLR